MNTTKEDLTFENVWQEEKGMSGLCIRIHFTYEGSTYFLDVMNIPHMPAEPIFVSHNAKGDKFCPVCAEARIYASNRNMCYCFSKEKECVFEQLITHPAIRLQWVTKNHNYYQMKEEI